MYSDVNFMYEVSMNTPSCWNCTRSVWGSMIRDTRNLIGCQDNMQIKSYADAKVSCPVLTHNKDAEYKVLICKLKLLITSGVRTENEVISDLGLLDDDKGENES